MEGTKQYEIGNKLLIIIIIIIINSAKNFLGKIFLIIWVFIGETLLPSYPSWCQIIHLTKTETEPQMEQISPFQSQLAQSKAN